VKREEDERTNQQLNEYVSLDNLQSFFLMAGAGSGKTRSLVSMLEHLKREWRKNLKDTGRKIAVITFTKAASEEIQARISYDSTFHISTIHSFSWEMIRHFQKDIKEYLIQYCEEKLRELSTKKETDKQKREIEKYTKKLMKSKEATKFNYSPDTNITQWGYLSHSEVIKIMTDLLKNNSSFAKILIQKYPVLLIDECQDTNKNLLTYLIEIEANHDNFCLGLIGDMMQRVYTGGLEDLQKRVAHWGNSPKKEMNWRCQKRIVDFINELRKETDELQQYQNKEKNAGILRTYIIKEKDNDQERKDLENKIREHFSKEIDENAAITTLILEHKMAARRNGFSNIYLALDNSDTKDAVKDGTGKEMKCVKELVIPFIQAMKAPGEFELLRIFRKEKVFETMISIQKIGELKQKIDNIRPKINEQTTLREAVNYIKELNVTELPDAFLFPDEENSKTMNWQEAMNETLDEFKSYFDYKDEQSPYFTQQGSKGLEYDYVMVIMNDNESRGRMFSYGKLSGTTPPTATDLRNMNEGKDNSIERTKRLLYVAASRAKESLGLVIYSSNVDRTKEYFMKNGLVKDCEIITERDL